MAKREPWNPLLKSYPDSEKINSVSLGAETLYTRLIAQCDDNANYWGDPMMVLAKLFTHRMVAEEVEVGDVQSWLTELLQVGLIRSYKVGEKEFVRVINCKKHLRSDLKPCIEHPTNGNSLENKARTESVPNPGRSRFTIEQESVPSTTATTTTTATSTGARAESVPEVVDVKPPAHPQEILKAKKHMRDLYKKARTTDTNFPPLPKLDRWVEKVIWDAPNGKMGVDEVLSYTQHDFQNACNDFYSRRNKAVLFNGTWLQTAWNMRREAARETKHKAAIDGNRKAATENKLAVNLAEKQRWNKKQAAWEALSDSEKVAAVQASKAKLGRRVPINTIIQWWWNERKNDEKQDG